MKNDDVQPFDFFSPIINPRMFELYQNSTFIHEMHVKQQFESSFENCEFQKKIQVNSKKRMIVYKQIEKNIPK